MRKLFKIYTLNHFLKSINLPYFDKNQPNRDFRNTRLVYELLVSNVTWTMDFHQEGIEGSHNTRALDNSKTLPWIVEQYEFEIEGTSLLSQLTTAFVYKIMIPRTFMICIAISTADAAEKKDEDLYPQTST